MINRVMGSKVVPNIARTAAGGKGSKLMRFMQNETLGKVLDVAADNQTLCQSLFALAICVGPRPVTNFIVTEDKQDALYASCHSISSGGVGFVWPLVFATPIAAGLKRIGKNPAKYLNAKTIEKFYSGVAFKEVEKNGKKIKEVVTNEAGQMLRKDGSVYLSSQEPLMLYNQGQQELFRKKYPNHYVESKTNVVRKKPVQRPDGGWDHIQTEKGVGKFKIKGDIAYPVGNPIQAKNFAMDEEGYLRAIEFDKKGNVILDENKKPRLGAIIEEKDLIEITEEMEIAHKKEQNVHKFINMVPDILLAPARASLTIALIPPILNAFGIKKSDKSKGGQQAQIKPLNVVSKSDNTVKKGVA
ncbi:hypothetical protein J6O48_11175 [bacterium]|nr:hypothetical protein [bacterium]